jgi:hemolysin-activating ACP:hemolysin acyltransferase
MGQVVLAIMDLPRYRHQSLADLKHIIVNPLLQDRLAIAYKSVVDEDGSARIETDQIIGIAIWASVSDTVDEKISEQVKSGVFPIRLAPNDWSGGSNIWLIDVVAGDQRAATTVLANFRQLCGSNSVKIHPVIASLIDPDVLGRLKK